MHVFHSVAEGGEKKVQGVCVYPVAVPLRFFIGLDDVGVELLAAAGSSRGAIAANKAKRFFLG